LAVAPTERELGERGRAQRSGVPDVFTVLLDFSYDYTQRRSSMSLQGSNDKEKLESLCQKTYKEQAVWFLNAYGFSP
jgi:hypothetical protein